MSNRQKHLEFIQDVVNRLANASFRLKGWAVVLVSALFVLTKEAWGGLVPVALLPVLFFWGLDGYFLWQERLFRALYDHVRELEEDSINFSMDVSGLGRGWKQSWTGATLSATLVLFYGALAATVVAVALLFSTIGKDA